MDAQIGSADALRRVLLTRLISYLQFHVWTCQETLCDRNSVPFDLRQCANVNHGHIIGPQACTLGAFDRHRFREQLFRSWN